MFQLDKEDIIVLSLLFLALALGWYIIFSNIRSSPKELCIENEFGKPKIEFFEFRCQRGK